MKSYSTSFYLTKSCQFYSILYTVVSVYFLGAYTGNYIVF